MKILYNAISVTERRFFYNLLKATFDVTSVKTLDGLNEEYVNSFDLIVNDRHLSRLSSESILNHINPTKVINGHLRSSLKTFVGEVYEKHFGNKLNVYYGEPTPDYLPNDNYFVKEEKQTTGKYFTSKSPVWKKGLVNQINYWNETGIYGVYFAFGKLIYSYNYSNDDDYYVKFGNVKKIEYYNNAKTMELFGGISEKLIAVATECGMDYGRFDLINDPRVGYVVIDVNNAPFGNQVFAKEFLQTDIMPEAVMIVKDLIVGMVK